ncbi:helix-turn-helix transcriptional regulator [Myroides odoratimimus]|uniref:helix-turn-helix domain-containing protein n=1 Tax=Myroides odoratimimus TaxID=76832 RepID=UPI002576655F|nr:helix-turn-helix transcriptional regulator [Myroides odoratimimus]MDM1496813.1 helix-turn-helix transcriptional regulator [Myroides odoratimimus]MDM1499037.1 helix-turn-helix transcriptional regulator [Myroides odoratimimus]MDM1507500.1 helix-turn-helix transcriptional regulator [Myroides odoratimimus]MDM1517985.1 helix-turn-helix transcriptional regulator [Myroides odoratimimus]
MSLKEDIAIYLKERRVELNLTMEELALLVWGDSSKRSQISRYESGKHSMSIDTLELLLKALQIDIKLSKKSL